MAKAQRSCCASFWLWFSRYVLGSLFILLLLPLAPFYRLHDGLTYLWFQSRFVSNPEEHRRKVAYVQDQVRAWNAGGRKKRMCSARPAWNTATVHNLNKSNLSQINLAGLNNVVEIDEGAKTVTLEPGLMMGQVTTILIARGWTIPVIPEIEVLTVGGIICGAGLESTSVRWGMPAAAALEFEVVTANGDVVHCSKDNHPDLFHSIGWSHGTLGFLTAVKFPLLPAKKYVRLEYHVAQSLEEAARLLRDPDHEFVEGIAYALDKYVVTYGEMSNRENPREGPVYHLNRWYSPFFSQHVENLMQRATRRSSGGRLPTHTQTGRPVSVDFIPLRDYYHRHTRGYFWGIPLGFPIAATRPFLLLFGWIFPFVDWRWVKRLILLVLTPGLYRFFFSILNILQDFVLPMEHFPVSMEFLQELTGIYPIWLCPCKMFNTPGMGHSRNPATDSEPYIDIGVYGTVSEEVAARGFDPMKGLSQLEAFVLRHEGFQGTYADMLLSREDFRRMFDHSLYDKVRVEYGAVDAFPEVYDKVGKDARGIQV